MKFRITFASNNILLIKLKNIIAITGIFLLVTSCSGGTTANNHYTQTQDQIAKHNQISQNPSSVESYPDVGPDYWPSMDPSSRIVYMNGMPLPKNSYYEPINLNYFVPINSITIIESTAYITSESYAYFHTLTPAEYPIAWSMFDSSTLSHPVSQIVGEAGDLYVVTVTWDSTINHNVYKVLKNHNNTGWHTIVIPIVDNSPYNNIHNMPLAVYHARVYVGYQGKILTATPADSSWSVLGGGSVPSFSGLAVSLYVESTGSTLYVVDGGNNVYSTNITLPPESSSYTKLGLIPSTVCGLNNSVYFMKTNLFNSDKNGNTYVCSTNGPVKISPVWNSSFPQTPAAIQMLTLMDDGTFYAANESTIWKLTPGNTNWESISYIVPGLRLKPSNPSKKVAITALSSHNELLYVGTTSGYFWISRPAYKTPWINITSTYPITDKATDPGDNLTQITINYPTMESYPLIYVSTKFNNVFYNYPFGNAMWMNWSVLGDPSQLSGNIISLTAADSFVYVLTDQNKIYYIDTNAIYTNTWNSCPNTVPFNVSNIYAMPKGTSASQPFLIAYPKDNNNSSYSMNNIYSNYNCGAWIKQGPGADNITNILSNNKSIAIATYNQSKKLNTDYVAPYPTSATASWSFQMVESFVSESTESAIELAAISSQSTAHLNPKTRSEAHIGIDFNANWPSIMKFPYYMRLFKYIGPADYLWVEVTGYEWDHEDLRPVTIHIYLPYRVTIYVDGYPYTVQVMDNPGDTSRFSLQFASTPTGTDSVIVNHVNVLGHEYQIEAPTLEFEGYGPTRWNILNDNTPSTTSTPMDCVFAEHPLFERRD